MQTLRTNQLVLPCVQVAEHKRAVDKMLEDKRAMYEAARAAEEREEAARCVGVIIGVAWTGKHCYTTRSPNTATKHSYIMWC
jgi:hypothetical protein